MKKYITAFIVLIICIGCSVSTFASNNYNFKPIPEFKPYGTIYYADNSNKQIRGGYVPCTVTLKGKMNANVVTLTTNFQPLVGFPTMDNALLWVTYRDGPGAPCVTKPRSTGKYGSYISVHESFALPPTATVSYGNGKFYMSSSALELTCDIN